MAAPRRIELRSPGRQPGIITTIRWGHIRDNYILSHSSSEYNSISFLVEGNCNFLQCFRTELPHTPTFRPISSKEVVLISILRVSLSGQLPLYGCS